MHGIHSELQVCLCGAWNIIMQGLQHIMLMYPDHGLVYTVFKTIRRRAFGFDGLATRIRSSICIPTLRLCRGLYQQKVQIVLKASNMQRMFHALKTVSTSSQFINLSNNQIYILVEPLSISFMSKTRQHTKLNHMPP